MAIQNRRGAYVDFDPSKMVAGEWAVVQTGYPGSSRGRAVFMAFDNAQIERMATYEDMEENIDEATADIQATLTQNVSAAVSSANQAASAANTAKDNANAATASATQAAQSASTAASNAATAATNAAAAAQDAQDATEAAETAIAAAETATDAANAATTNATAATTSATEAATNAGLAASSATQAAANAVAVANAAQLVANEAQATAEEAERILEEGAVSSFNGRAGAVVPTDQDYDATMIEYDTNISVADQLLSNATDIGANSLQLASLLAAYVDRTTPEYNLDTTAAAGTTDGDLYAAITALGWESEVLD